MSTPQQLSSPPPAFEAKVHVDLPSTTVVTNLSLKQALVGIAVVVALYYCGPPSGYAYHFATHDIVTALRYLPFSCQVALVAISIGAAMYIYSSRVRYYWTYYTYSPKAAVAVENEYKKKQEVKEVRRQRSGSSLRRSVLAGESN